MQEYLTTIRTAIIQAEEQETTVMPYEPDGNFEEDEHLLEHNAMETDTSVVKPQGCAVASGSPIGRKETDQMSSDPADGTTRLGADQE